MFDIFDLTSSFNLKNKGGGNPYTFYMELESSSQPTIGVVNGVVDVVETSPGVYVFSSMDNVTDVHLTNSPGTLAITKITLEKTDTLTSMASMFYPSANLSSLLEADFKSTIDTTSVTSMMSMMRGWSSLITPPDLTNLDTANVTSMASMMYGWSSIVTPPDLSTMNTEKVTTMYAMMYGWSSIATPPDLSTMNTANVNSMGYMMYGWSSIVVGNIGIEDFNIVFLIDATTMLSGSELTTAAYDQIIINWEAQPHLPNVTVDFGNSFLTTGGAAEAAKNDLINNDGWVITDGNDLVATQPIA